MLLSSILASFKSLLICFLFAKGHTCCSYAKGRNMNRGMRDGVTVPVRGSRFLLLSFCPAVNTVADRFLEYLVFRTPFTLVLLSRHPHALPDFLLLEFMSATRVTGAAVLPDCSDVVRAHCCKIWWPCSTSGHSGCPIPLLLSMNLPSLAFRCYVASASRCALTWH